ncbi:MAG TPA: response regulator transcription factor [Thermodesulfobacteriota bacterium]|nr:response regulator transcription factor [Thermodesulfobacteriota bacterium]
MGISLMLAVPCNIFLQCVRRILKSEEDIEIAAEALNHLEIISLIEQKRPDVLFIDTAIPHLSIMSILEKIRESNAPTKLLLLLHTQDEEAVIDCISLGVRGCLREISSLDQFVQAIRAVNQEEIWVERRVLTKVVTRLSSKIKLCPKNKLTPKEEKILSLVINGLSNKQIAKSLFIAEKTVKAHLGNIYAKVGINNRSDLISINHTSRDSKN